MSFVMYSGSWGSFERTPWVGEHSGSTRESQSGNDLAFYRPGPLSFVVEESGILAGPQGGESSSYHIHRKWIIILRVFGRESSGGGTVTLIPDDFNLFSLVFRSFCGTPGKR